MSTFFIVIGVIALALVVIFNIEAHFERKSYDKDVEYIKHRLESLFIANK